MPDFKHDHLREQTELLEKFSLFEETFMRLQEAYIRAESAKNGVAFDKSNIQNLLITDGERSGTDQLERMERMYNKYGLEYTKRNYGDEHAREAIDIIHNAGGTVSNAEDRKALIAEIDEHHISHHQASENHSGSAIDIRDDMFFKNRGGDEFSEQRLEALKDTATILGFKAPHIEKDHIHLAAVRGAENRKTEADLIIENTINNSPLKQSQVLSLQVKAEEVNTAIENSAPQEEIEKKKEGFLGELDGIMGIIALIATALFASNDTKAPATPTNANFDMDKAAKAANSGDLPTALKTTTKENITPTETPSDKNTEERNKSNAIE